jgi:hypothetical protein
MEQNDLSHVSQKSSSSFVWFVQRGIMSRDFFDFTRSSSWLIMNDGGRLRTPPFLGSIIDSRQIGQRMHMSTISDCCAPDWLDLNLYIFIYLLSKNVFIKCKIPFQN